MRAVSPPIITTGIVDVHADDGRVDLAAAARAGVVALIHKATEGRDFTDRAYAEAVPRARAAGLLVGLYHYANATDPVTQAEHFLRAADPHPDALLALDCEDNARSRFGTMNAQGAARFAQRVYDARGRWPLFYSFRSFIRAMRFDDDARAVLARCPLWEAQYAERSVAPASPVWSKVDLWQYTNGNHGPRDQSRYPRVTPGFTRRRQDRSAFVGAVDALRGWWSSAGLAPVA
jgi:lysozyme